MTQEYSEIGLIKPVSKLWRINDTLERRAETEGDITPPLIRHLMIGSESYASLLLIAPTKPFNLQNVDALLNQLTEEVNQLLARVGIDDLAFNQARLWECSMTDKVQMLSLPSLRTNEEIGQVTSIATRSVSDGQIPFSIADFYSDGRTYIRPILRKVIVFLCPNSNGVKLVEDSVGYLGSSIVNLPEFRLDRFFNLIPTLT